MPSDFLINVLYNVQKLKRWMNSYDEMLINYSYDNGGNEGVLVAAFCLSVAMEAVRMVSNVPSSSKACLWNCTSRSIFTLRTRNMAWVPLEEDSTPLYISEGGCACMYACMQQSRCAN